MLAAADYICVYASWSACAELGYYVPGTWDAAGESSLALLRLVSYSMLYALSVSAEG